MTKSDEIRRLYFRDKGFRLFMDWCYKNQELAEEIVCDPNLVAMKMNLDIEEVVRIFELANSHGIGRWEIEPSWVEE